MNQQYCCAHCVLMQTAQYTYALYKRIFIFIFYIYLGQMYCNLSEDSTIFRIKNTHLSFTKA